MHALRESIGRGHCCLPGAGLGAATVEVLCKPSLGARQVGAEEVREPRLAEAWEQLRRQVSFRWKNPDFLFRKPDFLLKNVDFTI